MRTLLPLMACLLASACTPRATERATLRGAVKPKMMVQAEIFVSSVLDQRHPTLRRAHAPLSIGGVALALPGAALGGVFTEGGLVIGDARTTITLADGTAGRPLPQLQRYLLARVGDVAQAARLLPGRPSTELEDAVRRLPQRQGIVVVPVLDQLDVVQMRTEAGWTGGSSTAEVTTSGASVERRRSPRSANVRLRLILIDVAEGRIRRQSVVYCRGSDSRLGAALQQAVDDGMQGLLAFAHDGR